MRAVAAAPSGDDFGSGYTSVMARPRIVLRLDPESGSEGFLQPFVDGELWCERRILPGARPAALAAPPPEARPSPRRGLAIYDGPGILEGQTRRIRVWAAPSGGYLLDLDSEETWTVSEAGAQVACHHRSAHRTESADLAWALGPPAVLALAMYGVHLLHAAAVAGTRGAVALAADSGVGKSTLAAAAAQWPRLGLRRVADDLLAVRLGAPESVALPRFPQLKLADPGPDAPVEAGSLPLIALCLLVRSEDAAGASLDRLEPASALRALIDATVGARLFDAGLLAGHFEACAAAASSLPVFRLHYASGLEQLEAPLALVATLADQR